MKDKRIKGKSGVTREVFWKEKISWKIEKIEKSALRNIPLLPSTLARGGRAGEWSIGSVEQ